MTTTNNAGMSWFRLYHSLANSVRVGMLTDRGFRLYILLQCAASEKRAGGRTGLTLSNASWRFRFDVDEPLLELVGKDPPLAMMDGDEIVIPDWDTRQTTADSSTPRTRAYRQRIALVGGNLHPDVVAEVRARDKDCCVYCGSRTNLVTDHGVPIIAGGDNGGDNLFTACKRCNSGKAGRTPEQAGYAFHNPAAEQVYLAAYERLFTRSRDGHGNKRDGHRDALEKRREEKRRTDTGQKPSPPADAGAQPAPAAPPAPVRRKAASRKANGVTPPPTNAAWDAYAAAYLDRYGAEPPRGPQVNGALANLLRNIPAEDLPAVATWYVRSNDPHVAREKHPITLLARSWQRWHTEWKTKGRQTATLSVVGQRTAENLRRWLENGEDGEKGEENHGTG